MYTDGSVYGKVVGYGARAAVLYNPSPSIEICYKSSAVGRMVSIEECEVDGIILGIDMITQYYNIHSVSCNNTTSYILSDSISAIESIDKIDPDIPLHGLKRLKVLCEQMVHVGINIKLIHIPGHAGLDSNIKADRLAQHSTSVVAILDFWLYRIFPSGGRVWGYKLSN